MSALDTLPKMLRHNGQNWPHDVALREKDFGIWRSYTWRDYAERTRDMALGLRALGVGRGDVVGLIGGNRPDWVMGEVAVHALGGLSLGIYGDALDDEVGYLVNFTGMRTLIAEDEEQVDKLLNLTDVLKDISTIIYADPRGIRKYDDPRLIALDALLAMGRATHEAAPGTWDALVDATRGDDVAVLCTTSGTTARPKLAQLSGGAMLAQCRAYLAVDPKGPQDEYVSVLPLPWIMEQIYVMGWGLLSRMKVNFVEDTETTMADFREIGPTFVLLAPRVWEGIAADVRAKILEASWLKQRMFALGQAIGLRALDRGKRSWLADFLLFRALRDRLGFSFLQSAATGGAALGPDTFRFFLAMGVPLRQIYGQTETLGAYTVHRQHDVDFDTVGIPFNDEIKIRIENPDANGVGEILTNHPNMFSGYYGMAETPDMHDGWLTTGDAGYYNKAGHLVVIDRIKDIATTSSGAKFSPQYIENKLKFSPFIAEAVVLGHERPHLAAMLCIRFPIVAKWAERRRIAFTTYSDLSANPEIVPLLLAEVAKVNRTLPEAQRIRQFVLLYKELDADDEELTRTRKVRRGTVARKYANIIEAIYNNAKSIDIDVTISLQGGASQRIQTVLQVIAADATETRP